MGFLDPNFIPKPTIFYDSKARFFQSLGCSWGSKGSHFGGLGRPLGGPGGAVGGHFGGLWVILAAFGAQTAPTTPSSLHFGGFGGQKGRQTASNKEQKSIKNRGKNQVKKWLGFLSVPGSVWLDFGGVFGGLDLEK